MEEEFAPLPVLTQLPQNGQLITYGDDSALRVRFENRAVEMKGKSEKEGRPIFEAREFIIISVPGGKTEVHRQVSQDDKRRFSRQYKLFQEQGESAVDGFPVEQWPQLTVDRVAVLKALGIHTVEQLASCPDVVLPRVGMDSIELREKARAFLNFAKETAQEQKLAAENSRLRDDLACMQEQIAELQKAYATAPKKRGKTEES